MGEGRSEVLKIKWKFIISQDSAGIHQEISLSITCTGLSQSQEDFNNPRRKLKVFGFGKLFA